MPSDLEIVNGALSRLGIAPISSIGENSEEGALAQSTYYIYRDQLLQSHPWNFAVDTISLSTASPIPEGYASAFQVPGDTLRVLSIVNLPDTEGWAIEGDKLYTNLDRTECWIKRIRKVTQSGRFSAGFADALMAKLAAEWAEALTSSNTLLDRMEALRDRKTRETRSFDGQEGTPKVVNHRGWVSQR
jgi:hypothetical protein